MSAKMGSEDPAANRHYKVFVGSEGVHLRSNCDDPVLQVVEQIVKNAVKP
jgi:hypothetical protein